LNKQELIKLNKQELIKLNKELNKRISQIEQRIK